MHRMYKHYKTIELSIHFDEWSLYPVYFGKLVVWAQDFFPAGNLLADLFEQIKCATDKIARILPRSIIEHE